VEVRTSGRGPEIVLIHSLLTGPEAYDQIAKALASHHTVHRVFLPGFGSSTPLPQDDLSIADLADVAAKTMEELGCDEAATVFGNGLGAFVALNVGIRHGGAFGPLIVANVGATFPEDRRGAFITMSQLADDGGMPAVADVAVKRIFPESFVAKHPTALERRRAVLERIDPGAFSAACRALARLDVSDEVRTIENPTLVIAGSIDMTTPPEMARDVARRIPGARLVTIADCGHCPQLEQPTALVEVIQTFLTDAG